MITIEAVTKLDGSKGLPEDFTKPGKDFGSHFDGEKYIFFESEEEKISYFDEHGLNPID